MLDPLVEETEDEEDEEIELEVPHLDEIGLPRTWSFPFPQLGNRVFLFVGSDSLLLF